MTEQRRNRLTAETERWAVAASVSHGRPFSRGVSGDIYMGKKKSASKTKSDLPAILKEAGAESLAPLLKKEALEDVDLLRSIGAASLVESLNEAGGEQAKVASFVAALFPGLGWEEPVDSGAGPTIRKSSSDDEWLLVDNETTSNSPLSKQQLKRQRQRQQQQQMQADAKAPSDDDADADGLQLEENPADNDDDDDELALEENPEEEEEADDDDGLQLEENPMDDDDDDDDDGLQLEDNDDEEDGPLLEENAADDDDDDDDGLQLEENEEGGDDELMLEENAEGGGDDDDGLCLEENAGGSSSDELGLEENEETSSSAAGKKKKKKKKKKVGGATAEVA